MINEQTKSLTLSRLKQSAKRAKKELQIPHTRALELVAREEGFASYFHAFRVLSKTETSGSNA